METLDDTSQIITNREAARVLFQVASLLETMECNPFRVRAYRRAALGVLFLPRNLAEYVQIGEQPPLPGVGERMLEKLSDLVNTGHMGVHETLMEEIGEPMMSLLAVEGIGPKTAIRLVSELGIQSLDDLATAVEGHQIQALRGFGPKREKRIAEAVEDLLGAA
jgi:DNA polymerase/3'-5' exonuclease PolX